MATAIILAELSNLLESEILERIQFKGFLVSLAISLVLIITPINSVVLFLGSYIALVAASFVILMYLVTKRREISDFLFFEAFGCLSISTVATEIGFVAEYTVLLVLFGMISIGLMFTASKDDDVENLASFIVLKRRLQKTEKALETTQKKLFRAERLAAIGELAGMVGHDLRNPLTGIKNATYYLRVKATHKLNNKEREMLSIIEEGIGRSDKIISDLLDYSGEIHLELGETTPKSIIREMLSFIKIPLNIRIVDAIQSERKIKVDRDKLKRVFVNIIKNAIDAMPEGGILTLESKESNYHIEFLFSDTGIGMSKETIEKIRVPLFTTKAKGMGFGLAICNRIVKAHEGEISVQSTVGKGTTFTVTIPIKPKPRGGEKEWMRPQESLLSMTTKA